jgi:hypothetical protein
VLLDMSKRPPWLAAYRVVPPLSVRVRWKQLGAQAPPSTPERMTGSKQQRSRSPTHAALDPAWHMGVGLALIRSEEHGATLPGPIFMLGERADNKDGRIR